MLFLLPIRTNMKPWHTPYANYALIAVNVIFFLVPLVLLRGSEESLDLFLLTPVRPHLWQFVTYAFLHGGIGHIVGNMFFLYIFGNNVNDKLGNLSYICFYLAGAVFSGIGHSLMSSNPVLGASGAVAAVTGAYLILFPKTLITVFYWLFYFIDTIQIPALYFIGFKLIFWDNVVERRFAGVAYDAHLSGYFFGVTAILLLLATGIIKGSSVDLWAMIKMWNRRRQYRDAVSDGYDPYSGGKRAKRIKVKEVDKPETPAQKEAVRYRQEITTRIAERNLPAATDAYLKLYELDESQILPRQQLLDIANQLMSQDKFIQSAAAYEQYLKHYPGSEHSEQVELMLGVILSRYLDKPKQAIKHLEAALKKLSDTAQQQMCRDELEKCKD